jgi:beta-lactamase superfamily II metal-dependent hydrolase
MATCLEAAGIEYPKTYAGRELIPLEGKSLLPIFRGEVRAGHPALFWEHEGNRAVRQGKWKLVSRHGKDWELYDLEADRTELADLVARLPEKASELAQLHAQWSARCGVEPWQKIQAIEARAPLDFYFIDTEGGAATLMVTPLRESILVDSGNPGERDAGRIAQVVQQAAGLKKIDHYITTHWHRDHAGGIARLVELVPVERFYDHGLPAAPAPDISPSDLEAYRRASQGKSTVLKAGDAIPLKSRETLPRLDLRIVAAAGLVQGEAAGAPQIGPCDRGHPVRPEDGSDNARSIAFLLTFGDFQFFDGADLTWNVEHKLACPRDLVGPVDVFQVDHHGLDLSNNPALVEALKPRAAIINNGPRKGGEARTFATLKGTPGLEAIFQLHRNLRTGAEENAPPEHIANDGESCSAEFIRLSIDPSGKSYSVTLPSKGICRTFESR